METSEPFSIPVPTTNQLQCYKDSDLAAVSPGEDCAGDEDPLAFKTSWSKFRPNLWLGDVLPKAIAWLQENPNIADDHARDDDDSNSE